ncbi:MAG: T9SS type A sorting domain-containing protein [Bacteroidetes bacterium]|nr:T9SS type A sorting domain-containing protein [Bacteroidota bacterium]
MRGIVKSILLLVFLAVSTTVSAHVNLLTPVGGTTVVVGNTMNIKWQEQIGHDADHWELYYSTDSGKTYMAIDLSIPYSQLTYTWTIPAIATTSLVIKIFQNNTAVDYQSVSGLITVDDPIGIIAFDANLNQAVSLYPNPCSATLNFEISDNLNNVEITVLDILGNVVFKRNSLNTYSDMLDVSNLASGIYFFNVITGDRKITKRFVKT